MERLPVVTEESFSTSIYVPFCTLNIRNVHLSSSCSVNGNFCGGDNSGTIIMSSHHTCRPSQ